MKTVKVLALLTAGVSSCLSALADASCIVSDDGGRIALIDSPLPGKSGSLVSSVALPIVYAWAIDWSRTESSDWPAFNQGMFLFVR